MVGSGCDSPQQGLQLIVKAYGLEIQALSLEWLVKNINREVICVIHNEWLFPPPSIIQRTEEGPSPHPQPEKLTS